MLARVGAVGMLALALAAGAGEPRVVESDVCVYGGTSGGAIAAVQAARMGRSVVVAEPGRHLGGMTAGGLCAVDIGDPRSVGGLAREYFTRLAGRYGVKLAWDRAFEGRGGGPATGGAFAVEPHAAEELFGQMLREAKVPVRFGARLAAVRKEGARIVGWVTEDGTVFRAKVFIDATYEGDLMAKAGVSYTLMREGNAKYGERYNGIQYAEKYRPRTGHAQPGPTGRVPGGQGVWDRDLPLDPYVVPGDPASGLLPLVQAGEPGREGDPAPGVQAYCFRLCLTTNAANRRPIEPPPDYDPRRYELAARFLAGCLAMGDDPDLRWFSKFDPLPAGKFDFNTATIGANLPGASWEWPEASHARREEIAKEHENYHRGLLHFLAADPRVPAKIREQMGRFGLCRDEFPDTGGWPHQIYVREARRMVSDLVMTEHHTFGRQTAPHSVGLGSYGTDTHEIRRIAKDGVVTREGKTATGRDGAPPYPIGYGALVPKAGECGNLLVTFAVSASHTAFSSIRMEPVFMVLGQSAATAACLAIGDGVPVQAVGYAKLRARLLEDGQVLDWAAVEAPGTKTPRLTLERTNNWLVIRGAHLPGGAIRVHYLEAYCRAGSTDADWVEHTVIPHRTETVSRSADGRELKLRCTLADGVTVDHTITARDDEVDFRLTAHNPGAKRSEAHWAQACPRLGDFTGVGEKGASLDDYLPKCFVFLDGRMQRMPTADWATQARYTPGQVWCPANVPRTDVNPRPLHPRAPDNGLIGCFSGDGQMIWATAWEPYQELFQGVARCLHADFRLGGLEPGATLAIRGRMYIVPADVDALLKRYRADFPEHVRAAPRPAGGTP